MYKHLRKFTIYSFTVLLAKLIYDVIIELLPVIKSTRNPYFDVAIGMGLTLIVFYPLYGLAHAWMEKVSGHYVKHSRGIHSNRTFALIVSYIFGIIVLFGCFMMVKFEINIVAEAFHAVKSFFVKL